MTDELSEELLKSQISLCGALMIIVDLFRRLNKSFMCPQMLIPKRSLIRNSVCEEVRTARTGRLLGGVKSAVKITHLLNQTNAMHLEKMHDCDKKRALYTYVQRKVHEFIRWSKKTLLMNAVVVRVTMCTQILDLLNFELFMTTEKESKP